MEFLTFESRGEIGVLTINRPQVLNALNVQLLNEMRSFLEEAGQKGELKVLILTGAGDKAFIAGADLKEMRDTQPSEISAFIALGQKVTMLLEEAPFVTLAAVNGYALGGGCEMALACDFIYASSKAKLGLPEITLGIIPGFGGTKRLSSAIGMRAAKEMIVTGKQISAEEGLLLGVINAVFEPERLLDECMGTAEKIARHSKIGLSRAKCAVNSGEHLSIHDALELERNMFSVCFATKEREMAMNAFLEKSRR